MDLPVRKNIRLNHYDYTKKGAYFITICVKGKNCILGDIVGGDAHIAPEVQLSECGHIVEKYMHSIPGIDRYVIMPNHIHMIVKIDSGLMQESAPTQKLSVPGIVRSLKILVTKEYGVSVWQRSYYEHIIRDEQDYLIKCRYIEQNPVNWAKDEYN